MSRMFGLLLIALVSCPIVAGAVSLDGIVVYSTDDFGNPIGFDWDADKMGHGLWRWDTQISGSWGGLGVLDGLPPDSFRKTPMNGDDFSISLSLIEGENDFTIVGATGGGNDDYQRIAVNLFFDGVVEYPSISILVPADSPLSGGQPTSNRSDLVLTLGLVEPLRMPVATTYSDDSDTVSVLAASFRRHPDVDVSIVGSHSLVGDGTMNWVGVLRLFVERIDSPSAPILRGPMGFSGRVTTGGEARVGPDLSGGPRYGAGPAAGDSNATQAARPHAAPTAPEPQEPQTPIETPSASEAEQTASPSVPSTAAPTTSAVATRSPAVTAASPVKSQGTPTPAGTPVSSTPGVHASPSAARTGTAAAALVTPSPVEPPRPREAAR